MTTRSKGPSESSAKSERACHWEPTTPTHTARTCCGPRNINQGDFDRIVAYARATAVCRKLAGCRDQWLFQSGIRRRRRKSGWALGCSRRSLGHFPGPSGAAAIQSVPRHRPELHLGEHCVERRSLQAGHGRFGASLQSSQRSRQCSYPFLQRQAIRIFWRFGLSRHDPDFAQAFHPELSTAGVLDVVAFHRRLDGSADAARAAGQQEPAPGSQQFEFRPAAPARRQRRVR